MTGRVVYASARADVSEGTRRPGTARNWGNEDEGDVGPDPRPGPTGPTSGATPGRRRGSACGQAFVLRLCLDLQLDAMLLALGAAAQEAGGVEDPSDPDVTTPVLPQAVRDPAGGPERPEPDAGRAGRAGRWRSWLDEDVDFACRLAAHVVASGASLPGILGSDASPSVTPGLIGNLAARYEAIWALLDDLDDCRSGRGTAGTRVPPSVRDHCRRRLGWLREAQRVRHVAPQNVSAGVPEAFPPGELLG